MDESKVQHWKGGLPYGPDVRKLEEAFPTPEEGQIIGHDEFEKVLKMKRGSARYYGVINKWRGNSTSKSGLFPERDIDTEWISGVGLKVLAPAERLHHGERDTRASIRHRTRARNRTLATPRDRLDDIGQRRYDLDAKAHAMARESDIALRRQIAIDLAPVKSLPKPKLQER